MACATLACGTASPQGEARPAVRVVVPAPPGGSFDATARLIAGRLAAVTGVAHYVENKPGANTLIGIDYFLRLPADGRSLLYAGSSIVLNPLLQKVPYTLSDLSPVAAVAAEPYALVGARNLPATTARDLQAIAVSRPGGLNCAAAPGPMTLACEQLRQRLGGTGVTVAFSGVAPALQAVAGGHADVMFVPPAAAMQLVEAGHLKLLALSSRSSRADAIESSVPMVGDIWPGMVLEGLHGIHVRAGTPAERVQALERDIARVMADPELPALMRAAGTEPIRGSSPERFSAELARQQAIFADLVTRLGLDKR